MKAKIVIPIIMFLLFGCSANSIENRSDKIDEKGEPTANTWELKVERFADVRNNDSIKKVEIIFGKPRFKTQSGNHLVYQYTESDGFGTMEYIQIEFKNNSVTGKEKGIISVDPW